MLKKTITDTIEHLKTHGPQIREELPTNIEW